MITRVVLLSSGARQFALKQSRRAREPSEDSYPWASCRAITRLPPCCTSSALSRVGGIGGVRDLDEHEPPRARWARDRRQRDVDLVAASPRAAAKLDGAERQ